MGLNNNAAVNKNTNILDTLVESVNKSYDKVQNNSDLVDGVDYINITVQGETELGKMLFLTYPHTFNTILGRCASVKHFITAITKPNFPLNLLSKPKFTKAEKAKVFGNKTGVMNVPNYWALVAYAYTARVKADKKLQELLIANTLDFVSFKVYRDKMIFGKSVNLMVPDTSMVRYIGIIKYIETMLKEGKFNNENIEKFINDCKYHPELEILDGTALNVSIKTTQNATEATTEQTITQETENNNSDTTPSV